MNINNNEGQLAIPVKLVSFTPDKQRYGRQLWNREDNLLIGGDGNPGNPCYSRYLLTFLKTHMGVRFTQTVVELPNDRIYYLQMQNVQVLHPNHTAHHENYIITIHNNTLYFDWVSLISPKLVSRTTTPPYFII